ncbi:MAG: hypothetical protein EP329_18670 [Deltaproteobacteria bacterium]|nr:MAG: hypothetical protein EP329_18670 [Deltaproteobacteria bacterium]
MEEPLGDDDSVFRGLPVGTNHYEWKGEQAVVKQSAFNDRSNKPSVDVKRLSPGQEPRPELHPHAGILELGVSAVRSLSGAVQTGLAEPPKSYAIDVAHRPEETNLAHAQIEGQPEIERGTHFKKVKIALARISAWLIPPPAP